MYAIIPPGSRLYDGVVAADVGAVGSRISRNDRERPFRWRHDREPALDRLAELAGAHVDRPEAKSLLGRGKLAGHEVLLAKPQTFMNLSGHAVGDLPGPPVYNKVNPADTPILTLALTSPTLPLPKLEDLADTRIAQKISQLPGVGLVSISGGQRPAVRIQVDTQALASRGLGMDAVRSAIAISPARRDPRA